MSKITYKELTGVYKIDEINKTLVGKIINIPETIYFKGETVRLIEIDFIDKVDTYIRTVKFRSGKRTKYMDGRMTVDITPEAHHSFHIIAACQGMTANELLLKMVHDKVNNP